MKVAFVHSRYRQDVPSGENTAVATQAELLQQAGVEVAQFSISTTRAEESALGQIRAAARVITEYGRSPLRELRAFRPDIVHVHNTFPNFGTHWLRQVELPIVATLHNFRSICANGLLYRSGQICFECPTTNPWAGVRHGCYRDSRIKTLPLAVRTSLGPSRSTLYQCAFRIIALSEAARQVFVRFGFPPERTVVLPNGIAMNDSLGNTPPSRGRWLYAGRLSSEKGVEELVSSWPAEEALDIVGEGPLSYNIEGSNPSVRLVGSLAHEELIRRLPEYVGLVMPSRCLEMQPTVVLEAWSQGIPVVALQGNAGSDLVDVYGGGSTYKSSRDLPAVLASVRTRREQYGTEGRAAFEQHFSAHAWTRRILELYHTCMR